MMAHTNPADKARSPNGYGEQLRGFVLDAVRRGLSLPDFAPPLCKRLLRLGHAAVADFLQRQGPGDLGPEMTLPDGRPLRRLPHLHPRERTGVFGTFTLHRTCYGTR